MGLNKRKTKAYLRSIDWSFPAVMCGMIVLLVITGFGN